MKTINKPIDMVVEFLSKEEFPKLQRFRLTDENEEHQVIVVKSISGKSREKINNSVCIRYLCKAVMNGYERQCEIIYDLAGMQWFIYKL